MRMNVAIGVVLASLAGGAATPANALDPVNFGTSWKAQAEQGGYYQAVATGIYEKHGIKVTIHQGGPQVNQRQFLISGQRDILMGSSMFSALAYARENVPMVAVAGIFQRAPLGLMVHPDNNQVNSLKDMAGKPIMVSQSQRENYWHFLKGKFGFTDDQLRPYTFNLGPFLVDKAAIQQVYATAEPFAVRKAAGFDPKVFLLSDVGFSDYGQLLETSLKWTREKPDLVQRFVNASIEGWYSFLYGDPKPGFDLIKKDNPDMPDDQMLYTHKAMQTLNIVDSGDAKTNGIGAMSDERWAEFTKIAVAAGFFPAGRDHRPAYTTAFVNKRHAIR